MDCVMTQPFLAATAQPFLAAMAADETLEGNHRALRRIARSSRGTVASRRRRSSRTETARPLGNKDDDDRRTPASAIWLEVAVTLREVQRAIAKAKQACFSNALICEPAFSAARWHDSGHSSDDCANEPF
jgi:hypothetical protein